MPKRIQRQRFKGWKMPANTIYVGRPSMFGNPFTGPDACVCYREWLAGTLQIVECNAIHFTDNGGEYECGNVMFFDKDRNKLNVNADFCTHGSQVPDISVLRGHNLACWCPLDRDCHADILLELANG